MSKMHKAINETKRQLHLSHALFCKRLAEKMENAHLTRLPYGNLPFEEVYMISGTDLFIARLTHDEINLYVHHVDKLREVKPSDMVRIRPAAFGPRSTIHGAFEVCDRHDRLWDHFIHLCEKIQTLNGFSDKLRN